MMGAMGSGRESEFVADRDDRRRRSLSPLTPGLRESTSPSLLHAGLEFPEVFYLKQGCYADLSPAKFSEMMKSKSLHNAPTQTLFRILEESVERKNEEISQRVACLLRKILQEIERRISTQADHIRNQNNLFKAREEKYQSRMKVLETLVAGTSEERQMLMNQLLLTKTKKTKTEERMKVCEQEILRLLKENENSEIVISKLRHDLETKEKLHDHNCRIMETKTEETRLSLEKRVDEVEFLLAESRRKAREIEAYTASKLQDWKSKEQMFGNYIGLQLESLQDLKTSSMSIKSEVTNTQQRWCEEFDSLGMKLKALTVATEKYQTVVAENRRLYNEVLNLKGNIRVYCRIRPFLSGEDKKSSIIDYSGESGELVVGNQFKQRKDAQRLFKFNKVFEPSATQEDIFMNIQPLIRSVLDGYNVCIFAYGQTGSGKTYTMTGPSISSKEDWGVSHRALNDLFNISVSRRDIYKYEICVQMVEIYNEQVRDLLVDHGPQKRLGIWNVSQPNGLSVPDASMLPVNSTSDVLELMQIGLANRSVGATALNDRSSRSHCVLTAHVHGEDLRTRATLHGSLHLIDLAGSERVDRSEVTGDRLKEAQNINKSLSALGDVISALSQKSTHVPFRNSKLTQVLQSSLGGQAKTLMLVQINPDMESYSETLSTLKFAERVSGVELGAAQSTKEGTDVKNLMEQVVSLRSIVARKDNETEQLQKLKAVGTRYPSTNNVSHASNLLRHSSSSPGIQSLGRTTRQSQRSTAENVISINQMSASDPENDSDCSDWHSQDGSNQSSDDLKHLKDIQLLGPGNANLEERPRDTFNGGPSICSETDSSSSSVHEPTFHYHGKSSGISKLTRPRIRSTIPLPLNAQARSGQKKTMDSLKPSGSLNKATSQVKTSSAKPQSRWQ